MASWRRWTRFGTNIVSWPHRGAHHRLSADQAHALFELVAARYERRPTVLTSNLTFAEWGSLLGDDVLASALLDRLLHHAEVVAINGRSYRMRQRLPGDLPAAS